MDEFKEFAEQAFKDKNVKFLCKLFFDVDVTPMQEKIIRAIAFKEHPRIVISCLTRYGKTYCVGFGVCLYILLNPRKKIGLIAPIREQASILRNYISDFLLRHHVFRNLVELDVTGIERIKKEVSKTRITFVNGCTLQILSAEGSAERLMGHGFDLVVEDESCLIKREVYRQKISRMLGDSADSMLVEIGNPWDPDSHMYDHWISPDYLKFHVNWQIAIAEGRTTKAFVEEQRKQLSPNEFKVLYDAEFPVNAEDALIQWTWIQKALVESIPDVKGKGLFGCDIAEAGNDFTVVTQVEKLEDGFWNVNKIDFWHKADTTETAKEIKALFAIHKPANIFVDAIGVGKGVADMLNEWRLPTSAVKVGRAATREVDRFSNQKAQFYWKLRCLFEDNLIRIPNIPNRNKLVSELGKMKYELTVGGKIKIVDPENKSPDFADSLMLAVSNANDGTFFILE